LLINITTSECARQVELLTPFALRLVLVINSTNTLIEDKIVASALEASCQRHGR